MLPFCVHLRNFVLRMEAETLYLEESVKFVKIGLSGS